MASSPTATEDFEDDFVAEGLRRWEHVALREGDIIVATPAKCGTTWTQTICALLVFGTPDLPATIDELSPWVEMPIRTVDELRTTLEAQRHRRFIKSHGSLDRLPQDDRVTYICVGRDPRDVAISMDRHRANMNMEKFAERFAAAGHPPPPPAAAAEMQPKGETLLERVWSWIDSDHKVYGLPGTVDHLRTFWERRDQPNVVLLHYADLETDLEGQMRGLAARLGITIDDHRWPDLVRAATFDNMKSNAEAFAPENTMWHDTAGFFAKGTSGQWRELLDSDDDLRRYERRISELIDPEMSEWLHRGPIR